jgi:2-iminobutanoate/2-iminopropanoate deaminase
MQKIVATDKAPKAIGPYSQAVQAGDFLFASGQIPLDAASGQLVTGSIEDQAKRVLDNIKSIVEAAGFTMRQIVKATVFVTDMEDFTPINGVYAQYFGENPPARSFVAVKELPKGAQVEIEIIAWKG